MATAKPTNEGTIMTKAEALKMFRAEGGVVRGDVTATRVNWNDFTDYLAKAGMITWHQCNTWANPF